MKTTIRVTCSGCGKEFGREPWQRPAKTYFCSAICRGWKVARTGETRQCAYCGNDFYVTQGDIKTRTSLWCSVKCADLGGKKGTERACKTCGKQFYIYPSRFKDPEFRGDYCSHKCKGPATRAAHLGKVVTESQKLKQSATMKAKPYKARKPPTQAPLPCEHCGAIIIVPSRMTYRAPEIRFCNTECWYEHIRIHPEVGGNWKGGRFPYYGPNWTHQAKLARERDNHTCQKCGIRQVNPRLDVHHVRPRREFTTDFLAANALDNLTTLCKACHGSEKARH